MKVWITGYIGSGKSTLASKIGNVFEFDFIEKRLKDKGHKLSNLSNKEYKALVKEELMSLNNVVLEGIQCCDYYTKGDKVYFVKTNFFTSTNRALKRDGKKKSLRNIFDNLALFFKLKLLSFKVRKNKDLIKKVEEIQSFQDKKQFKN